MFGKIKPTKFEKFLTVVQYLLIATMMIWSAIRMYNVWDEPLTMGEYNSIGFIPFIFCFPPLALIIYLRFFRD